MGYTPATAQRTFSISYDESKTPRTFSCFGEGYPSPSLVWRFNGGPLPDGLVSIPVTDTNLQLQWRRDLHYGDSGQYQCVAENELNTSIAILNIIVTGELLNLVAALMVAAQPGRVCLIPVAYGSSTAWSCVLDPSSLW